ncbi:unnamed protein product [Rotaria sp. Silwood2]|nr:unnamed protein product [Rotaria sp. Silwood2]
MSSKGIAAHKIRTIMHKAAMYPMDITEIFAKNICVLIDNICSSSQMPREYRITMLLPAIDHFINGSQIRTKSGNITVENPVLNIAAAAHPADIFSSVSNESDVE